MFRVREYFKLIDQTPSKFQVPSHRNKATVTKIKLLILLIMGGICKISIPPLNKNLTDFMIHNMITKNVFTFTLSTNDPNLFAAEEMFCNNG